MTYPDFEENLFYYSKTVRTYADLLFLYRIVQNLLDVEKISNSFIRYFLQHNV